jgi:adenylate kinase
VCGGNVVARDDDVDEAALKERLAVYHDQTEPLYEYYERTGRLRKIDGTGSPDEVFSRIVEALG